MVRLATYGLLACLLPGCSGTGDPHAVEGAPAAVSLGGPVLRFDGPGHTLFEYRRDPDALKPYLRSLVTPGGIELVRDAPPDHEHHHGLMLALGVDDVDFWGERYAEVPGRQVAEPLGGASVRLGPQGAGGWLAERVEWLDPRDGGLRLEELREVDFETARADRPTRLTWWSRLRLPPGRERAVLWGRPYFGLGLRFAAGFDGTGRFSSSDGDEGVVVRGDERLTAARWCACTTEIAERTVTVAMYDHPDNPRHPARFFTMAEPFAYLSATLDLAERPLELTRGEQLDLCWGLAVWEQPVTPERIEEHYRTWSDGVAAHRMATRPLGSESQGE